MNRACRRAVAKSPGRYEHLINEAWENGFQAGKTFSCKTLCSAISLALHELHGLSGEEILAMYRNATERIFAADCPEILSVECAEQCGVPPEAFDFDQQGDDSL